MTPYLAVLKGRLSVLFQYRGAALAGLSTQFFWGIIKITIFQAFYQQSGANEPLTLEQAITFIWLGQALLQLLPWNIDKELEGQIKTGHVAYELLRPLNMYGLWFFRAIAMRAVPTLMRCLPVFIFAGIFFNLSSPVSWNAGLVFGISLIFALFLSSAITTLIIISFFWTLAGEGIQRLLPQLTLLLSGIVVPLPLFPAWVQPFLNLQPFRGMIDIPARIYTGIIPVSETLYYLGFQLGWFLVIAVLGHFLMKSALKRFVIEGG